MTLYDLHPDAKIGENVTISNFTTIYEDVVIGDGTWIGPNVTIFPGTRIGKNCRIFPGAVIGAIPQDLKFAGEYTTVEIGDNNTIRECCTINRGTAAAGKTVIGNGNLLMAYVHIAHDCVVGDNCVLANNATLAGHIIMGDYVILGGKTACLQFIHIGSHVITQGGALIDKDIPPSSRPPATPYSTAASTASACNAAASRAKASTTSPTSTATSSSKACPWPTPSNRSRSSTATPTRASKCWPLSAAATPA